MLGIIDNKFMIGRDEFFPFSAEMHYFRVEKRYWSICFERIKKAGFKIISTYIPWNLHEERPGDFDFRGFTGPDKDLIVFLELAREFGFKVILKPAPRTENHWPILPSSEATMIEVPPASRSASTTLTPVGVILICSCKI